jgi:phage gp29-like protein
MDLLERITSAAGSLLEAAAERLRSTPGGRGAEVAIPAPYVDREAQVLGNSVSPETLSRIILARNTGDLREWVDLADHARRTYPHLHTQLALREQAVVETEYLVEPGEGSNKQAAKRAADACTELFAEWRARGFETWAAEIVGAKYYPAGLHEVVWERHGGLIAPVGLERIAERRLSYACDRSDPGPWRLRINDSGDALSRFNTVYGTPVEAFHPDKFLVHEPRVVGGHRASEGLFAVVCWYWLFGVYSWRDLMALLEMLGRPPVVGYYNAGGAKEDGALKKGNGNRAATQVERDAALKALTKMSSAMRAVLPDTVRLEALNFEVPANPHQILTSDKVNELLSKAINGTTGVTDIVAGARASHETAADQAMTPYRADCRSVERAGGELFRRFVRANPDRFGATTPIPRLCAQNEAPKDLEKLAKTLQVAKATGARIPEVWYHDALGIPLPKGEERLLGEGQEPPPQAPGQGPQNQPPPQRPTENP